MAVTISDLTAFRNELKSDIHVIKEELSNQIGSVNSNLREVIAELKIIGINNTKSINEHEIAIAEMKTEQANRPTKSCEETIKRICEEQTKTNNQHLLIRHTEIHDEKAKNKLNFVDTIIKISIGVFALFGAISAVMRLVG